MRGVRGTNMEETMKIKKSSKIKDFFMSTTKRIKDFFMSTTNGMALGLFATLIIGTIIGTIALPFNVAGNDGLLGTYTTLTALATALKFATGFGIGIGVAYAMKMDGLKLISGAVSGFIASYMSKGTDGFAWSYTYGFKIGDPLTIYLVVVISLLLVKLILRKKTPVDIILVPVLTSVIALVVTLIINQPVYFITTVFKNLFSAISGLDNLALIALSGLVISVLMGICLTLPISSAAIAVIFSVDKVAGACALVGCCCQMVGFAVQSYRDNGFGKSLGVGVGTSMIQFKNIIKKPVIWLPTIIASAILGPIVGILGYQCDASGAGMGTCAFVGQITSVSGMTTAGAPWWQTTIFIGVFQIILPFVLVYLIDLLFRKKGWIKKGDLTL